MSCVSSSTECSSPLITDSDQNYHAEYKSGLVPVYGPVGTMARAIIGDKNKMMAWARLRLWLAENKMKAWARLRL